VLFAVLRTFAAQQGTANSVGGTEGTTRRLGKLPDRAALTPRVCKVTGASEIFAGNRFEYITHGF
jgi:hypothetical protein